MKEENFNISGHKTRVLVAPLEWGLGHTTRCIPIIREMIANGCEVVIGVESAAKTLLEQEFPTALFLPLKGYRMKYSRKKTGLPLRLMLQIPKLIGSIYHENRWLKRAVLENSIDLVISDNRLGLYHSSVPCVYITHQLLIKTGNSFTQWVAQKMHYHFINKYSACWVPDAAGEINLAGELSHPRYLPKTPVTYLGPLSRFEKNIAPIKYDLTIILSGPEPQRTIFEDLLLLQLNNFSGRVLFVRGMPGNLSPQQTSPSNIEIKDHLPAAALNKVIEESALIISRSGYTTIMDLVKLQQKAILVPTPGQTEQEYLGARLMKKKLFYCVNQNEFDLAVALDDFNKFPLVPLALNQDEYKSVIKNFISGLIRR